MRLPNNWQTYAQYEKAPTGAANIRRDETSENIVRTLDVTELVDEGGFQGLRILVAVLCCFAVLIDGFDTQAIGYIAPSLASDWHLSQASLAPVFVSSLVGLMCGAFVFGPLSDRWGRKTVLSVCVALFGMLSLATAFSNSLPELLLLRFLTGLGLGGVMPNAVALTSEYAPSRIRSTVVMMMFCGFSLGAVLGGLVAASVISHFGWRAVFVIGGVAPLLLTFFLIVWLKESVLFMVTKNAPRERVAAIVQRLLAPHQKIDADTIFWVRRHETSQFPVAALFAEGLAAKTLLLWVIFFASLFELYLISSWLPVLFHQSGFSVRDAVLVGTLFQAGGVVGTLLLGTLIDRRRPFIVLTVTYVMAALFVEAIAVLVGTGVAWVAIAVLCAGFCVVGAQIGANAMAARLYPTAVRATGVGWAFAVGRVGSIAGPSIAGLLVANNWGPADIFRVGIIPLAIAAIAAAAIHRRDVATAAPAILKERLKP
jgi:AAHS family 4-hydroxybenzoate transporter-like MFS transporter